MKRKLKPVSHKRKSLAVKAGMPPGALVYIGDKTPEEMKKDIPKITVFEYDQAGVNEYTLNPEQIENFKAKPGKKLWLNVHGIHDVDLIKKVTGQFKLHPLVVEDILNTEQRPKIDTFEEYLFIESQFFTYNSSQVNAEQVSIVLGKNYVLSFQERSTGVFEPIRQRLRAENGQMHNLDCDYLSYAILDVLVDSYFGVLDQLTEDCETLEDTILAKPSSKELHDLHQLKRATNELRRHVGPLREVLNHLMRNEHGFLKAQTLPYIHDIYDHIVHFIESLETQRETLASMMDIYLSTVSNRVNLEVRALTVVTMLFMPATLITGIFGMNFDAMPWLKDIDGFWWAIGLMAAVAGTMLLIFWRHQWLSSKG